MIKKFLTKLLVLSLVCVANLLHAQEEQQLDSMQSVTMVFDNSTIEEVLKQIEAQTTYTFFFAKEWLQGQSRSGNYSNTNAAIVLRDIFQDTPLNNKPDKTELLTPFFIQKAGDLKKQVSKRFESANRIETL